MATQSALKKVAAAITNMTAAVSNTFVESAKSIAAECFNAFDGSLDIEPSDIKSIQDAVQAEATWRKSKWAESRRSEVKSIVLAYLWLEPAAKVFKKQYGELRREHFVKIARFCCDPEMPDATTAAMYGVEYFQKRDAGKGGKGTPANLGMAIGIIKNTQKHDGLSKSKLNAFRRDLKELCDKYGIAY